MNQKQIIAKRRNLMFYPDDDEMIRKLVQMYGCLSETQAIRLAIKFLASLPKQEVELPLVSSNVRESMKVKLYKEERNV